MLVGGAVADKSARLVGADEPIVLRGGGPRFVGRGGEKLDAALTQFGVDVAGRTALDAGSSTGGFTDCLLQRGAARVYAVDVGYGQLAASLRADERVVVRERTNVRTMSPADLAGPPGPPGAFEPVSLVVADLSFISLRTVAPALCGPVAAADAELVVLVKPQFEAGRVEVSRGAGVISDPDLWLGALADVASALEEQGTGIMGAMPSPLRGAAGNVEFFLHARRQRPTVAELGAVLAAAVGRVGDEPAGS